MKPIFISSVDAYCGKSALCIGLLSVLTERGYSVGYMKPVGNALVDVDGMLMDEDAIMMKRLFALDEPLEMITPLLATERLVHDALRGKTKALAQKVHSAFVQLSDDKDIVLVEGAEGVEFGAVFGLEAREISSLLGTTNVLVSPYTKGLADHVLAGVRLLGGENLCGVLINGVPRERMEWTESLVGGFLNSRAVNVLGILPHEPTLGNLEVREVADAINAHVLAGESGLGRQVNSMLIGAMGLQTSAKVFRRGAGSVVIIGAGRSEIISTAIECGVACVVATGEHAPECVLLSYAEERGVPVLHFRGDALTAIESLESVLGRIKIRNRDDVAIAHRLVEEHVDIDTLLSCATGEKKAECA
ncbi:MAG: AAA family ATPase [Methermicoccaceae archaeon]